MQDTQHVDTKMIGIKPQLKAKLIDSAVFDSFGTLTSDNKKGRLNGSIKLLQHLTQSQHEKKEKERDYTLNRLIRGLGASTSASRTGFFTTLVGFLSITPSEELSIEDILLVMNKQLHVSTGVNDKEDSDGLIGHILLCGALVRSNRLLNASNDDITKCLLVLVKASKHKTFHSSLAYTFLIDLLQNLSTEHFESSLWPIMKKELNRPWEKHTINTIYFLLATKDKYHDKINSTFLENSIKTSEILSPISFKHIGRLFWGNTSVTAIAHPAYDTLGKFLAKSNSHQLTNFWTSEINETLSAPNKIKEVVTLKILTDVLNDAPADQLVLTKLISKKFIKMITSSMKNFKQNKHEYLSAFYDEFFDALIKYFNKINDDSEKVNIITKFILHPGTLLIEKYTSQKIIHQLVSKLGQTGVVELFVIYKNIFLGKLAKNHKDSNANWLHFEKLYAGQMMQYLIGQKVVQNDIEWRTDQLKFMLTVGLFYISEDGLPIKKDHDSGIVTKDLCFHFKNFFFSSLHTKLQNLKLEKRLLFKVVEFVNNFISKKSANKYFKDPLTEKSLQSWNSMYNIVTTYKSENKKNKKLDLTFHIMFLHMGLQLFREPNMAQIAIVDLEQCLQKTQSIKEVKKKSTKLNDMETEPEWIEVVVDLFLHLLSQNTTFLRNVVNSLFPHLCANLSLTAIHQMLSVLDMKDGKNPLSSNAEMEDSSSEEENENVASDDEDEKSTDDEKEEDELMEEEEGTVSDHLRNAISTALGAAAPQTDTDSVDLNDMNDEEAERLDNALSAAFQSIKKTNSKKKSKKERATNTTVMHFRIRVVELIEIYLKNNPKMLVSMEIMLSLFNMTEYCLDSDLKILSIKVDRVLKKLLAIRHFENIEDLTEENLTSFLTTLVTKKVNPIALENQNQLLSKLFMFIINCSELLSKANTKKTKSTNTVLELITEYTKEFIKSRNPQITFSLLQDICKIRWIGVWKIGKMLVDTGLQQDIRPFRRAQGMELLVLMYKNHGFILHEINQFNKINKSIGTSINNYLTRLNNSDNVSAKEFASVVCLLTEIHKCHKMPSVELTLEWTTIGNTVQEIRTKTNLISVHTYALFCREFGMTMLKKVPQIEFKENGLNKSTASDDEMDNNADEKEHNISPKKTKRKSTDDRNSKKEKKIKKEERLRIASEGFNGFSFTDTPTDVSLDEVAPANSSTDSDSD